jgi:hypothetical protein
MYWYSYNSAHDLHDFIGAQLERVFHVTFRALPSHLVLELAYSSGILDYQELDSK